MSKIETKYVTVVESVEVETDEISEVSFTSAEAHTSGRLIITRSNWPHSSSIYLNMKKRGDGIHLDLEQTDALRGALNSLEGRYLTEPKQAEATASTVKPRTLIFEPEIFSCTLSGKGVDLYVDRSNDLSGAFITFGNYTNQAWITKSELPFLIAKLQAIFDSCE